MTRPSRALLALQLVADLLNIGRTRTTWRVTTDDLHRTPPRPGRSLERITLWKTIGQHRDGADTGTSEFASLTEIAVRAHLNEIDPEPGAAWYSNGLTVNDPSVWERYPQGEAVIAYITFWKLTDEAAATAAGTLH